MKDQYYYKVSHRHFGLLLVTPVKNRVVELITEKSGEDKSTIQERLEDISEGYNDYGSVTVFKYKDED